MIRDLTFFDQKNPPPLGVFLSVSLAVVTKCCGFELTGFCSGADENFLYLSHTKCTHRESKVGWDLIFECVPVFETDTCIDAF